MRRGITSNVETYASSDISNQFKVGEIIDQSGVVAEEAQVEDITEELELDPTVDAETLAQSLNAARAQEVVDTPSQEEINAACIIQATYRRKRTRQLGGVRTKLSEARRRFFIKCWAESEKIEWPRRHYRLLFLGPLPHLLLCLERANTSAFESKMISKRRLTAATHLQIEDEQMRMTEANRVLKEILRLQKALEPTAAIHKLRDFLALKAYVRGAEILIRGLPCAKELEDDLCLATKGIVTEPSQNKKQRPALHFDDDDVYD